MSKNKKKKKISKNGKPFKIFEAFLKVEPQFKEYLGYGEEEIRKIGICKFIKAMGWTNANQVNSWKTDVLHIVTCQICGKDFAIYETEFAICKECSKGYNMNAISKFMESARYSGDMETYMAANIALRDRIFLDGHFKIKTKTEENIKGKADNESVKQTT